jgi:uncharacterized repeat protein (TIGR03803 family)
MRTCARPSTLCFSALRTGSPCLDAVAVAVAGALWILLVLPLAGWGADSFSVVSSRAFGVPELSGHDPYASLLQGGDGALYGTGQSGGGNAGVVFKLNPAGGGYTVLHAFTGTGGDGAAPYGGLLEGSDGTLYGTTRDGGAAGRGTVFRLRKDGSEYRVLYGFAGSPDDGAHPYATLIEGRDGALYGTTHLGGVTNQGTVFRLTKDGGGYRVLHVFTGTGGNGSQPASRLVEGSDGVLYGTTYFGGVANRGLVFVLGKDGTGWRVVYSFPAAGNDGAFPYAGLVEGGDGRLYGTTTEGGASGVGTVFALNKNGSGYRVLRSFSGSGTEGAQPYSELFEDSDGLLYGSTAFGGTAGAGTVYRLGRDGSGFRVLHGFAGIPTDGAVPYAGLILGRDGALYATTWAGGTEDVGTAYKLNRDGGGYRMLHDFRRAGGDVEEPYAGLLEGRDGLLYGAAWGGGAADRGAIFRADQDGGRYTLLHSFTGRDGDGASPYSAVVEGRDGVLYGATVSGGTTNQGTVFALNQDGSGYRVLRSFTARNGDGGHPYAGVTEGTDGVLYGATIGGGTTNQGVVFRLDKNGSNYRVLRSFLRTAADGGQPYARLIEGRDGLLYGTTAFGGGADHGSVYRLNRDGTGYQVLRLFTGTAGDGARPYAGLLEHTNGVLYGTTHFGGVTNEGTVYRLNRDGSGYVVLHSFSPADGDGARPSGSLVEGSDGALYGTTYFGGTANQGTVFRLAPDGSSYRVIHSLTGVGGDGANPYAGLIRDAQGALRGTTVAGGAGFGTFFRLAPEASLALGPAGELSVAGPPGYRFTVQVLDGTGVSGPWQNLVDVTVGAEPARWVDPAFATGSRRLYRAILKP